MTIETPEWRPLSSLRSWVPPQDNSAKSIVGYRIYRDNGQGGAIDTQLALLDETTFSYRDASLVTGQVYYYRPLGGVLSFDRGLPWKLVLFFNLCLKKQKS